MGRIAGSTAKEPDDSSPCSRFEAERVAPFEPQGASAIAARAVSQAETRAIGRDEEKKFVVT